MTEESSLGYVLTYIIHRYLELRDSVINAKP